MTTLFGRFPDKTIEELRDEALRPEEIEWQRFTGRQYRKYAGNEPRITLGAKGVFYLNLGAFRMLGEPLAVELMMDKMRHVIGMRPIESRQHSAFRVHKKTQGEYRRINASAFCQHFRLYTGDTLLFHNVKFDDEGVLRLDLVNATKVGRGAR